ncbi:hypothetical protein ASE95_02700 [Sphingomonas sp. Leaf231]|uniref:hypothetical protein n=1 Tax=Sphingomonas sp. Leaf231 TaxID=1736301 RepID=UPI0006F77E2B|nr:hypothetical protein [Sphingomonas sp. Leaf231]KQN93833.1 hypothetical protein ASE95_02700 [Sphingomonas sp. Leaf231]
MPARIYHRHKMLRTGMVQIAEAARCWPDLDMAALLRARLTFARALRRYLATEQEMLENLPPTALRREAIDDLQLLLGEYSALVSHWTPDLIQVNWSSYIAALKNFDLHLNQRLRWEDHELLTTLLAPQAA